MEDGLSLLSSSFTWVIILDGDASSEALDFISVLQTAINRAEGTPLPETSAMVNRNLFSSIK